MPNPQHLSFLKEALLNQDADQWNEWRLDHPEERIDLSYADLHDAYLSGIDLRKANLTGANLSGADLNDSDLDGASLENADLQGAKLDFDIRSLNVLAWNKWREANPDVHPDLSMQDFPKAVLAGVNFSGCSLSGTNMHAANLRAANLSFADLIGADLTRADLAQANLTDAYLCGADLEETNLSGADLQRARMDTQENFVQDRGRGDNARTELLRKRLEYEHSRGGNRWYIERETNFNKANLSGANLDGANLRQADLSNADLHDAKLSANLREAYLSNANLRNADLSQANLEDADLSRAVLHGAKLCEAFLGGATLTNADLSGADLRDAYLRGTDLIQANFEGADLRRVDFSPDVAWTKLNDANLTKADLREANLGNTDLTNAILSKANLRGACLNEAQLIRTDLRGANLCGVTVYGVSVWDVQTDKNTKQHGLIITPEHRPKVTVDDLEVAQFIYLLMENRKIRNILDTITSKAVLILGRFTKKRKPVLEAVYSALRDTHGLVPILFDFEPSPKRDITETVQLLANLCRFVIADLTDAKSIPQELSHIIPYMPSVPVQPIILAAQTEYAMFEHWRKFNSVLPEFPYRDKRHLLDNLEACVIKPVEKWEQKVKKAVTRERLLQEKIKRLEAENAKLRVLQNAGLDTPG